MEIMRLKNDSKEALPLISTTLLVLEVVIEENPLALYDLLAKCQEKSYRFFGDNEEYLVKKKLVEPGGAIHDSIKNIVLSAVEIDGMSIQISSPIK